MWGPETSGADSAFVRKAALHFGKAYLYHNLADCSVCRVLTCDDAVAGIFCVREIRFRKKNLFYALKSFLNLLPLLCHKKLRAYCSGWKRYFHFCKVQEFRLPKNFDVEIKLLFTREEFRGKGLGSKMLFEIKRLLEEKGESSFFLHTDTECDYGFYDKAGLVMLDKISFPIPSDENYTMYVYGSKCVQEK